jgi:hypothetical protein
MEKILNGHLRENERICWQGKPLPFPLMEKATKLRILTNWILTVTVAVGLLVVYVTHNEERNIGFTGVVVLVAIVIVSSPVLEWRRILKQQYWITDQRVIVHTGDKNIYYMELSDIDDYRVVGDLTDQDCLVLGRCLFDTVEKQMRWRACHPMVELESQVGADHAQGLVLYGIGDTSAVETLIRPHTNGRAA